QIENDAVIGGNIVCGGNVVLKDRVRVQGDISCTGILTTVESAPPVISGTVTQGASVANVAIPAKPAIAYGTTSRPIGSGESVTLSPGSYKDLIIDGTVTLTAGVYNFRSLKINNNGTLLFDVSIDKTVEVNIETSLELLDRATAEFVTKGYAPCVKIYTNAYSIDIGTNVQLCGILTAPNALVNINSRTQIEGAIYAKSISLEPDAVVISSFVNPNADDDGDCIPNLTEMMIGDKPDRGDDYTLMGVPHPAVIDNSPDRSRSISYDFGCKYSYFTCGWSISYPAGSLVKESVSPAFTVTNKPPAGIPEFSQSGYKPVGNYMSMIANSLKSGQSIYMVLPLFSDALPGFSYNIAWYNSDSSRWEVTSATPVETCALMTDEEIGDASAMIIVKSESRTVAYLDNGMTYSNETKAKLRLNIKVDATLADNPAQNGGAITINYLEHTVANPQGIPANPLVIPVVNYRGTGFLSVVGDYEFTTKITVTGIEINSLNFFPAVSTNENFIVEPGQTLNLEVYRTLEEMKNTEFTGDRISAFYDVYALTFESMAFEEGTIKESGGSWGYDYYLKDHLGSTRMVVDDKDMLAGAYMYQPYGTVDDIENVSLDRVREKFTGKELDEDGAINGAPGLRLEYFGKRYYDPELGIWISTDPAEEFWNAYSYCGGNPINFIDPFGLSVTTIIFDVGVTIWADKALLALLNVGVMISEAMYVAQMANQHPTLHLQTYSNSEFNFSSDMQHSTASRSMSDIQADIDVQLRRAIEAGGVSIAGQSAFSPTVTKPVANFSKTNEAIGKTSVSNRASTPIGRRGNPLQVPRGTNSPTSIGGRNFTGHALDQMQARGIMPSVVENAILTGAKSAGNTAGTTVHIVEEVKVITNTLGDVITVIPR
ncbi:MAG: DUF4258 domain-containing protein, partial [Fibrobacter sp.]|nr:DUF4258 domain-containing protein [Fibrobacter sp.]